MSVMTVWCSGCLLDDKGGGGPSAAMDNGRSWPGVRREVPAGDKPVGSSVGPAYLARPTRSEEGHNSSPLRGGRGVPAYCHTFYVLAFQSETAGNFTCSRGSRVAKLTSTSSVHTGRRRLRL